MTEAAIYCRISKDTAGTGLGVKRQEEDCRALAHARGWNVAAVHVDNDLSAYSGKRRPAYETLVASIDAGKVGAVIVWHPDRLHRSTRELEGFIALIERTNAKVATVQAGELDLATASGRMTARVVGAVARHEAEHKSERQKRKHLELALVGRQAGGGSRPYGFEPDRIAIKEDEADIIREMAKRMLAGDTLRGICNDLNRRGVPTVTGARWSSPVVRRLLIAPRTAGLREHRGEVVAQAEWEPIITPGERERLVRFFQDPARTTRRPARSHLLAGVVHCGLCDARLVSRPRADGARCYVCASGERFGGCGKIRSLAEPLEELIIEAMLQRVDHPGFWQEMTTGNSDTGAEVADELATVEGQIVQLADDEASGLVTRSEWLAKRARLAERRDVLQQRLAAASSSTVLDHLAGAGVLRERWNGAGGEEPMPFDQRRAALGAIISKVIVGPAVRGRNRFDPDRVDIEWKA